MKTSSQRGVALVITLIMLSVTLFLTIAFVAISRRERSSVTVSTTQTDARMMADAGLARAESEIVSRILARTNALVGDLTVSRNFINRSGFYPGIISPTNVNFDYRWDTGVALSPDEFVQSVANLQLDPRVPVYVRTNVTDPLAPNDYRFYLDINRNGRFETNGYTTVFETNNFPMLNSSNQWVSNYFVGDPEWIGLLERPEYPHSATNRFIGRYAYLIQPIGKTLDWNYIHNYAKGTLGLVSDMTAGDGFLRNQGYGSWELNLAGFLQDLNTNLYDVNLYDYRPTAPPNVISPSGGPAFDHAFGLLRYRYAGDYRTLQTYGSLFSWSPTDWTVYPQFDNVDGHANGPIVTNFFEALTNEYQPDPAFLPYDQDSPNQSWAGATSTNRFYNYSDILTTLAYRDAATGLPNMPATNNLFRQATNLLWACKQNGSYDRYTFTRLLAQIGTDTRADMMVTVGNSNKVSRPKINLNSSNDYLHGILSTNGMPNVMPWAAADFFTNAADLMLRQQFDLPLTNVTLYPTNWYTPGVHRVLQVAANLYDAARPQTWTNPIPTAFRPSYQVQGGVLSLAGYVEETNIVFLGDPWYTLDQAAALGNGVYNNINIYGVPLIIGACKGLPNFNEFVAETVLQVTRKLELRRPALTSPPNLTNQMYLLTISNRFGGELWNAYTNTIRRDLRVVMTNMFCVALLDSSSNAIWPAGGISWRTIGVDLQTNNWLWYGAPDPRSFVIPLQTNSLFLNAQRYEHATQTFRPTNDIPSFEQGQGFYIPQWTLQVSNRLIYALIDMSSNRILDYVTFDNMNVTVDIARTIINGEAYPNLNDSLNPWRTNRLNDLSGDTVPTYGVINQLLIAQGQRGNSDDFWKRYSDGGTAIDNRSSSAAKFNKFMIPSATGDNPPGLTAQAPFSPSRLFYHRANWQANDPLVHYTTWEMLDEKTANHSQAIIPPTPEVMSAYMTNNLGKLNDRYRPWGGRRQPLGVALQESTDADTDRKLKDPMVRWADDWNFPEGRFASLGWMGRVHRGTPWQTLYMKPEASLPEAWQGWVCPTPTLYGPFSHAMHPTNDWRLYDLFTVTPNENAVKGILSVNQTNMAAWSAVLAGVKVPMLTNDSGGQFIWVPHYIEPMAWQDTNSPLYQIVTNINGTRNFMSNGTFNSLGDFLRVPALTVESPFLRTNFLSQAAFDAGKDYFNDEVYEWLPQQILSLVKVGEPRFAIYAFGQALKPANNSIHTGTANFGICTNYQITGEFATRTILRVDDATDLANPTNRPKVVIESYNILP